MAIQPFFSFKDLPLSAFWVVVGLFILIFLLEFSSPPDYVFGYLYIGPILLASSRLNRTLTFQATFLACFLTLLNVWIPDFNTVSASTIASRFIATLALVVTGILSDRNRAYQQTLLQQHAKLQAQEKLANVREDFAATLAHDLKTPLLGAIETLKAFQNQNFGTVQPGQSKVLTTMIRSHQTTLQMIETLLDIYRNDIEGLSLHLVPVDLVEVTEDVVTALMDLAASRRISITINYSQSEFRQILWVKGDAFQLQRVLTNLLTNAINHSPRGGKVDVIFETGSFNQTVKIIDTGAGIKPEELPYLFKRFYQGGSDRQARGTGLGLYLSRQIIDAHHGTIWTENRYPTGAIFAFSLPTIPLQLHPNP